MAILNIPTHVPGQKEAAVLVTVLLDKLDLCSHLWQLNNYLSSKCAREYVVIICSDVDTLKFLLFFFLNRTADTVNRLVGVLWLSIYNANEIFHLNGDLQIFAFFPIVK